MVQVCIITIQSMMRLMERNLYVRARTDHLPIIKSILANSEAHFTKILDVSGKKMETSLDISEYRLEDIKKNM
jgi:hypothetical protein